MCNGCACNLCRHVGKVIHYGNVNEVSIISFVIAVISIKSPPFQSMHKLPKMLFSVIIIFSSELLMKPHIYTIV